MAVESVIFNYFDKKKYIMKANKKIKKIIM